MISSNQFEVDRTIDFILEKNCSTVHNNSGGKTSSNDVRCPDKKIQ